MNFTNAESKFVHYFPNLRRSVFLIATFLCVLPKVVYSDGETAPPKVDSSVSSSEGSSKQKSCASLSDELCKNLEKNKGVLKTKFGDINNGKSPKGALPYPTWVYYQTLIEKAPKLPSDRSKMTAGSATCMFMKRPISKWQLK